MQAQLPDETGYGRQHGRAIYHPSLDGDGGITGVGLHRRGGPTKKRRAKGSHTKSSTASSRSRKRSHRSDRKYPAGRSRDRPRNRGGAGGGGAPSSLSREQERVLGAVAKLTDLSKYGGVRAGASGIPGPQGPPGTHTVKEEGKRDLERIAKGLVANVGSHVTSEVAKQVKPAVQSEYDFIRGRVDAMINEGTKKMPVEKVKELIKIDNDNRMQTVDDKLKTYTQYQDHRMAMIEQKSSDAIQMALNGVSIQNDEMVRLGEERKTMQDYRSALENEQLDSPDPKVSVMLAPFRAAKAATLYIESETSKLEAHVNARFAGVENVHAVDHTETVNEFRKVGDAIRGVEADIDRVEAKGASDITHVYKTITAQGDRYARKSPAKYTGDRAYQVPASSVAAAGSVQSMGNMQDPDTIMRSINAAAAAASGSLEGTD